MKQKIIQFLLFLLSLLSLVFIFFHNKEVASVILDSCNIFLKKVFVSLFPMFILNDIFISLGLPQVLAITMTPIFKVLFKTNGLVAYVFFMSMLSGTPSNAYILKELVRENAMDIKSANHALTFTYFSNPLFLFTMLSLIFDLQTTIKIIIAHYLSNVFIGIILRNKAPIENDFNFYTKKTSINLTSSIKKSMNTLLMILGTIIFYMLITYIFTNIIPLPSLFKTLIAGFLEITNGLNQLTKLDVILPLKEILAVTIISFGGLSIHTQIKAIIEDSKLSYKTFLKGRIMQTIISIFLVIIF